jgi:hypothetical protein
MSSPPAQFIPIDATYTRGRVPVKIEPEEFLLNYSKIQAKASDIYDVNTTYASDLVEVAGFDLTKHCVDTDCLVETTGKGEGVSKCYSPLEFPHQPERAKVLIAHDEWFKSRCLVRSAIKKVCNDIAQLATSRIQAANNSLDIQSNAISKAHMLNGDVDDFGELIYTHGATFGNSGRKRSRTDMEMGKSYKLESPGRVPPHKDSKHHAFRGGCVVTTIFFTIAVAPGGVIDDALTGGRRLISTASRRA